MKLIIDAHGGDNAPLCVLRGAEIALQKEKDLTILLCGKEQELRALMEKQRISTERFEFVNCSEVVEMCDDPAAIIRQKKDASMVVGLRLLRDGVGDAFVSAGSTGALLAGATLITGRIKGVRRAALAPILPGGESGVMLIDSGANSEVSAEHLLDFGIMGLAYMRYVKGVTSPRAGLLNVGEEPSKGTPVHRQGYVLLKAALGERFIGNIEARDVLSGRADVVVADGFSGNILLKTIEGVAFFFIDRLRHILKVGVRSKIGALLVKSKIREGFKMLDYAETGGAPLMGISKPVIKAHGSSNARAYSNALLQAVAFSRSGAIEAIAREKQELGSIEGMDDVLSEN